MVHLAMNSNAIAVRCAQCLQILELVLSSARIEDLCHTFALSICVILLGLRMYVFVRTSRSVAANRYGIAMSFIFCRGDIMTVEERFRPRAVVGDFAITVHKLEKESR